jgi:uncharacterized C2H2 Zn-finger protein
LRQKLSTKKAERRFREIFVACPQCEALNKARALQARKKCEKCGWIFRIPKKTPTEVKKHKVEIK